MGYSPAGRDLRKQKAYADLQAALDNLSTLNILRSNPKFRQVIWDIADKTLTAFNHIPENEKYLDAIESNIRLLDTFYHATPQTWRQLAKREHVVISQQGHLGVQSIFNPPSWWDKYGNTLVVGSIVGIVGPVVTYLIIHYGFHGP
jgi:hypothetical protein